MSSRFQIDERVGVAAMWFKGQLHKSYEDRFRLLSGDVPLVARSSRVAQLYAVADGVGSAPLGMAAAQRLCERLVEFYEIGDDADSRLHLVRRHEKLTP